MKLQWHIEKSDVQYVREFINSQRTDRFVSRRIRRNIRRKRARVTRPVFWKSLISCLITTQQRSGPHSAVYRFMHHRPFPLSYATCKQARNLRGLARKAFAADKLRWSDKLADQVAANFIALDGLTWKEVSGRLTKLQGRPNASVERETAEFLSDLLIGIGPKQSRNLLQHLGLTRYEIPLDSRNMRWFNKFGFPVRLSATGLADPHYYALVLDGVQSLCNMVGEYPCVLDAAIFASYDNGAWGTEDE
jgi:hypothetical protein